MPELPPPPADPASQPAELSSPVTGPILAWLTRVAGDRSLLRPSLALAGGVLALAVLGAIAWTAFVVGPGRAPPPELTMPRADVGDSRDARSGPGLDSGSGSGAAPIVAHVAGAVLRPGLYRLGPAPRIADAIDAAGGAAADADTDVVNLAAPVADGDRVYLPRRGETPPVVGGAGATGTAPGPLDLNAATAEQLDALPGIGPSTASAILAYRAEHGRFRSVDELLDVRGIGEAKLAELRAKLRVR